jgi:urease accessory protein
VLQTSSTSTAHPPGSAALAFCRSGEKTVLSRALAVSPLRVLTPRNHGNSAWVFLASLGGGLVDGDRLSVDADVAEGASAFIGTQASTKVYRSAHGCSACLTARVEKGAGLAIVPDPVVCFSGARYRQEITVSLASDASLVLLDSYTCGRSARGERWEFAHYASRTKVVREDAPVIIDATRLDPAHGPIAERMGRFDVVMSLVAMGPLFASVRAAILAPAPAPSPGNAAIATASPIGDSGAILRVLADRFESASRILRPSFSALAHILGDDPFARKW